MSSAIMWDQSQGSLTAPEPLAPIHSSVEDVALLQESAENHDFPRNDPGLMDQIDNINLLQVSKQDILHLNPISEVQEQFPAFQTIEDVLFYRYGYFIDEIPYQGVPITHENFKRTFKSFSTLCCAVGGQHLSVIQQEPIIDFIDILIASTRPFNNMPSKYWDLNLSNSAALTDIDSVHFHIEVKRFPGS